jgi:electron transport complex protein RnfB
VRSSANGEQVARILAVLPQTQCTRCGYPDCSGYAQAIAQGDADLNQCPPGGTQGIHRLANVTGRPPKALDPAFGSEAPRLMALIDEDWCIGCTLCIKSCPTDAIVGMRQRMHTVIERYCTGCERCLPVCPVDCIKLENASGEATGWLAWSQNAADTARIRYEFASARHKRNAPQRLKKLEEKTLGKSVDVSAPSRPTLQQQKRAVIDDAIARARARRAPLKPPAAPEQPKEA